LRTNRHCNPKLQHSWNYYGEDKFSFSILEEIEPDQTKLFEREQYYLDTFKPYIRGLGYNIGSIAKGGDNITHHPGREAFIEKMSEISSGENNPMFGRNHTEESIKKQKDKAKGRFTLPWFIDRYGKQKGQKKFDERRLMLAKRIPHSHEAWNKGKSTGKWKHKDGWLERRKNTEEYLSNHYGDFKALVLSGKYSQRELCKKLGMGRQALRKHFNKIKNPEGG
jgi:group I intron endonuclease